MAEFYQKDVKCGHWYYDNTIKKGVSIVAINYDYWYELEKSDGLNMGDERPNLNDNGEMYMIHWFDADFNNRESFSVAGLTLEEAIKRAEVITAQKIEWIS